MTHWSSKRVPGSRRLPRSRRFPLVHGFPLGFTGAKRCAYSRLTGVVLANCLVYDYTSTVRLRVQPGTIPIYQQISDQIRRRVSAGRLEAGERLPSVRALAEQLAVNANTVARAYRELERERFVVSRQGDGVFVADRSSPFLARDRRKLLDGAVDRLLVEAEQLDFDLEAVEAALRERFSHRGRAGAGSKSTTRKGRKDRQR